jgi:hypothetical protein
MVVGSVAKNSMMMVIETEIWMKIGVPVIIVLSAILLCCTIGSIILITIKQNENDKNEFFTIQPMDFEMLWERNLSQQLQQSINSSVDGFNSPLTEIVVVNEDERSFEKLPV